MIISITGDLGSGKSTVSKILKERLNYEYIYTGKIQREIADKYKMTTLELNKYAETHPEIDEQIDAVFKSLNDSINLIDISFTGHIPNDFPINFSKYLDFNYSGINFDISKFKKINISNLQSNY